VLKESGGKRLFGGDESWGSIFTNKIRSRAMDVSLFQSMFRFLKRFLAYSHGFRDVDIISALRHFIPNKQN
jgi:hypothetical protein